MKFKLRTAVACLSLFVAASGGWDRSVRAQERSQSKDPFELLATDSEAASERPGISASQLLVVDVADGKLVMPELREDEPAPDAGATTGVVPKASVVERGATEGTRLPGDKDAVAYVMEACAYYSVDPELVFCLIRQESGGRQFAVSNKGASGYMQLMPATARRFGVTDIFNKRQNIWAGVRYLKLLLNMFGDSVPLALAGYNAGEHRVIREGYRVPRIAETVNYVRAITGRYGRLTHRYPSAPGTVTSAAPLLRTLPGRS